MLIEPKLFNKVQKSSNCAKCRHCITKTIKICSQTHHKLYNLDFNVTNCKFFAKNQKKESKK